MLNQSHTRRAIAAAAAGFLVSNVAQASPNVDAVKNAVKAVTKLEVVKIQPSKITGLYEVHTAGPLFYSDAKGEYIILGGTVFTTEGHENYSEKRMNELAGYKFADLPLRDAVKIVRGNGKRVIVTFEDPNCGYCKKLNATLEEMGDMTHYVFMIGMLGDESVTKSNAIWCSADPAKTWSDWMTANRPVSASAKTCETPVERNGKLAQKYKVQGTPAVFFQNGDRAPGALPKEALERHFAKQPK